MWKQLTWSNKEMKINYYDLQETYFYIRQDQCLGRVYINVAPEINVEASGDFIEIVNTVFGQESNDQKDDHTLCWSNVNVQDVIKLINAIYETGEPEIQQLGMPVEISYLIKEIRLAGERGTKHSLRLVG